MPDHTVNEEAVEAMAKSAFEAYHLAHRRWEDQDEAERERWRRSRRLELKVAAPIILKCERERWGELIALAIIWSGDGEGEPGDLIPQDVWNGLFDRKLLVTGRDITDEAYTDITEKGREVLRSALAAALPAEEAD